MVNIDIYFNFPIDIFNEFYSNLHNFSQVLTVISFYKDLQESLNYSRMTFR